MSVNGGGPSGPGSLSATRAEELDRVCDRFEAASRAGERPKIEDYLAGVAEPLRSALVGELIAIEVAWRLRRGESPTPAEYRRGFPAHADPATAFGPATASVGAGATGTAVSNDVLLGLLALHNDLIDREALLAALAARSDDRETPVGSILVDRGLLDSGTRVLLESLATRHLEAPDGQAKAGLAALVSTGPLLDDPSRTTDGERRPDLAHAAAARRYDGASDAADRSGVGSSTSGGSRFRIVRPHARGGLGEVFLARDTELNRDVALKEIQARYADDPRFRSRFEFEAEITGGLEHPGVVPVYGLGHGPDGRPFYAMRFIRGDSLREAIGRFHDAEIRPGRDDGQSTLELRELLGRFLDVCDAIAYAHSRGVLHRDLKPGNIMLGRFGETLVVDWGLAKVVDQPEEAPADPGDHPLRPSSGSRLDPTRAGSAMGTPAYMSPEQAEGRLDRVGPGSDVYCLGATLYHLLTGSAPCAAEHLADLIRKVTAGEIPPPRTRNPRLSPALAAVCMKALALRPEDRYESAEALKRDLERWLADEPVTAHRERPAERLRRWMRHHRRLVAAATAAGLATLIGLLAIATVVSISNARLAVANRTIREINAGLDQARRDAVSERDQARAVTDFLVSSFRKPDPEQDGRKVTVAEVLAGAVKELEGRQIAAPSRATILSAVGETYRSLGLVSESIDVFSRVLEIRRELEGDDRRLLSAMNDLGGALLAAGQFDRAAELLERAYAESRRKLGEDDLDTTDVMAGLATLYQARNELDRAIPLFEKVLAIKKARLTTDDPKVLSAENNLAVVYLWSGQPDRAIPLAQHTLDAWRKTLGEDHPDTLLALNNLAGAHADRGEPERAIPLYEHALRSRRDKLGEDHPLTLVTADNLATVYADALQLDKAIALQEQVLKAMRIKPGADHPDTLRSMNNLGVSYLQARRMERAIPMLGETLDKRRARLGKSHFETLVSERNLAKAHDMAGRPADAEPLLRDVVGASARQTPRNDGFYADSLFLLAQCLTRQRRFDEAAPLVQDALKIQEKAGPESWKTAVSRGLMGEIDAGKGEFERAEPVLLASHETLVTRRKEILPMVRAQTLRDSVERLIRLYDGWGKPAEAERWRKERSDTGSD